MNTNASLTEKPSVARNPERSAFAELRVERFVTQAVILVLALISGAMTFEGAYLLNVRVGGESFATVAAAGLLAIGITSAIMTAWWVIMSIVPTLHSPRRILAGITLVIALQGWMLNVSSANNIIALGASDALISHMERTHSDLENAVSHALHRALSVKPYVGILEGEAAGRCEQAEGERLRGSMSGSSGTGAVSGILDLLCEQSRAISETLRQSIASTEGRASEADEILHRLDSVIWNHEFPVLERERQFLELVGDVKTWLRLTASEDLAKTLRSAHGLMAAALAPSSIADSAFAQTQVEVISGLRSSIETTGQRYEEIAAELSATPQPDLPQSVRISLIEAVWLSRADLLPQIAAAIGIDFFQIFMVLIFLLARSKSAR